MRMNPDIILRLAIASLLAYAPFTWIFDDYSFASRMKYLQPDGGQFVIVVMLIVALIIYIDVVVNSFCNFLPRLKLTADHRGEIYILGAFLSFSVLGLVFRHATVTVGPIFFYLLVCALCVSMAIIDVQKKYIHRFDGVDRRKLASK